LLKKENEVSHVESLLIGKVEDSLEPRERKMLEQLLEKQPELKGNLHLFEKTFLRPDFTIVFPDKKRLKKSSVIRHLYFPASVAASLLLVLGAFYFNLNESKKHVGGIQSSSINALKVGANQPVELAIQSAPVQKSAPIRVKLIAGKPIQLSEPESYSEELSFIQEPEIPVSKVTETALSSEQEFKTLPDLAKEITTNKINQLIPSTKGDKSLWDFASAGINGVGKLTGLNIRVEAQKDSLGNTIATSFVAGGFEFARSKGR